MKTILCILLGYLLGSLPFALIIGKVFYHTDIRQYGSGNLGGTNAGSCRHLDRTCLLYRTLLSNIRKIPWRKSC